MKQIAVIVSWIGVLAVGAFLRFDHLASRPMHADEATGARLTGHRSESSGYRFDPSHYHGPLLSGIAMSLGRLRGESRWPEMTKETLRAGPAVAGTLLVLVPLLWRRRWGDGPMLLAAALLATSPLLVYYSRMFIHEIYLALFGMLALLVILPASRRWFAGALAGVLVGLMFATKETFVISILAWGAAGLVVLLENYRHLTRDRLGEVWRDYRVPVAVAVGAALITATFFYTGGFRRWEGARDAVLTFFVYDTVEGHDKGPWYYMGVLIRPVRDAGHWWFETPVALLALCAWIATYLRRCDPGWRRATIRFLAYSAIGHFVIYSLFAYKTPWLMCLPWAHVCLLAGFSVWGFAGWRRGGQAAMAVVLAAVLALQVVQARRATGALETDDRNPYAYVPTNRDIEVLELELLQIDRSLPDDYSLSPAAVIGTNYWPLPWYLRRFQHVGYWGDPPEQLERFPMVFASSDSLDAVMMRLGETHTFQPRGLRFEAPVFVFIRNDLWNHWMEVGEP